MATKDFLSRFNTVGALRVRAKNSKAINNNVNDFSKLFCSNYDDPIVTYAYDNRWNVRLQKFVHDPVFECGYVE